MLTKPEKLLPAKQWREGTADSQAVKKFIRRFANQLHVDELQRQWRIQKHTEDQQELQSWLDNDDDDR